MTPFFLSVYPVLASLITLKAVAFKAFPALKAPLMRPLKEIDGLLFIELLWPLL